METTKNSSMKCRNIIGYTPTAVAELLQKTIEGLGVHFSFQNIDTPYAEGKDVMFGFTTNRGTIFKGILTVVFGECELKSAITLPTGKTLNTEPLNKLINTSVKNFLSCIPEKKMMPPHEVAHLATKKGSPELVAEFERNKQVGEM